MHKLEYFALSPGDRKVAIQLRRVFLVVYLIALALLGAFAMTSAKLLAPTAASGPHPPSPASTRHGSCWRKS